MMSFQEMSRIRNFTRFLSSRLMHIIIAVGEAWSRVNQDMCGLLGCFK